MSIGKAHILIYEPRTEGHHIPWLVCLAEGLLSLGFELTLALDLRTSKARELIAARSKDLLNVVTIMSAFDASGKFIGGSKLQSAAKCFETSGADELFFNSLDEVASSMFRKAVIGKRPPKSIKGRISGIYIRPRPLDPNESGLKNWFKSIGFNKLYREGWFNKILLVDEFLIPSVEKEYPKLPFYFLPDPWKGDFSLSQSEARAALGISTDKLLLTHYGIGSRRKGLHLIVEAIRQSPDFPYFLLVAGPQEDEVRLKALRELEASGRARVMDRYISDANEEAQIICAADLVSLPYVDHYGSSNLLGRAAAAGKPVIASDYHLIGKRVEKHHLGYSFKNNSLENLIQVLGKIKECRKNLELEFTSQLANYAQLHSFKGYKEVIYLAFG